MPQIRSQLDLRSPIWCGGDVTIRRDEFLRFRNNQRVAVTLGNRRLSIGLLRPKRLGYGEKNNTKARKNDSIDQTQHSRSLALNKIRLRTVSEKHHNHSGKMDQTARHVYQVQDRPCDYAAARIPSVYL